MFIISLLAESKGTVGDIDETRVSPVIITLGSHYGPALQKSRCTNVKHTVYPKKYAHGFVVLCFVVVMQSFIMNSHEVFIHIHQGWFADTGAIVRLPQCQWSKPDGYGKISQCITTTKHSKATTVCIFLGIYCSFDLTKRHQNLNFDLRAKYGDYIVCWIDRFIKEDAIIYI